MNSYYECHITIEHKDATYVRPRVEGMKWKFSMIEGDIVLGDGVKMYATRHFKASMPAHEVKDALMEAAEMLHILGVKRIVRRKVELVIFDDRSSKVDACNGGCIECHLDDLHNTADAEQKITGP